MKYLPNIKYFLRCSTNMKTLELIYVRFFITLFYSFENFNFSFQNSNMPPQYYIELMGKFPNLTKLNVYGSMVDDTGFAQIGRNCSKLIELNAGGTWLSNTGIRELSIAPTPVGECIMPGQAPNYRLPNIAIVDFTDTRVNAEGLSLFLVCHPKLVKMNHPETFHAFDLKKIQGDTSKVMLRHLATVEKYITPEEFEFAIESCPALESVIITSAGLSDEHLYRLGFCLNMC